MDQYSTTMEIIQARHSETEPAQKRLLQVAGLYCSYLQLRRRSPTKTVLFWGGRPPRCGHSSDG